jgi:hypothetical protein
VIGSTIACGIPIASIVTMAALRPNYANQSGIALISFVFLIALVNQE